MAVSVFPDDLSTYLRMAPGTIDEDSASLILGLTVSLCLSIVNPLPDGAESVIYAVAARAFTNPTGATAETVGPYTVQRPASSLYLTKADKATLRRLAGSGAAFGIDPLPTGVDAVQTITVAATAGSFVLGLTGQLTAPIAWNATAADIQAALGALSLIGVGNVSVAGTGPFVVTFINDMGHCPVATLTVDATELTGTVTVVDTVRGVFRPGEDLPYWDRSFSRRGRGWFYR